MKICIIGAGFIAAAHAAGYATVPRADLRGVADVRQEAAETLAASYGCRAYTDTREMLQAEKPDAVSVCVPTHLHRDAVCLALESGADVLCEKPLALSMADVIAMQDTALRCGRQVMAAQVLRFWPEYTVIRDTATGGTLGSLRRLNAQRIAHSSRGEWFGDPQKGGGALFDLMVHDLDYVVCLLGRHAKSLYATGRKNALGGWVHVNALLEWANGVQVCLEASGDMPPGYPFTIRFRADGESGSVELASQSLQNIATAKDVSSRLFCVCGGETRMLNPGDCPEGANAQAFSRQLNAFCAGVETGKLPIPFQESVYVMKLIEKLLASLNNGGKETIVDF